MNFLRRYIYFRSTPMPFIEIKRNDINIASTTNFIHLPLVYILILSIRINTPTDFCKKQQHFFFNNLSNFDNTKLYKEFGRANGSGFVCVCKFNTTTEHIYTYIVIETRFIQRKTTYIIYIYIFIILVYYKIYILYNRKD